MDSAIANSSQSSPSADASLPNDPNPSIVIDVSSLTDKEAGEMVEAQLPLTRFPDAFVQPIVHDTTQGSESAESKDTVESSGVAEDYDSLSKPNYEMKGSEETKVLDRWDQTLSDRRETTEAVLDETLNVPDQKEGSDACDTQETESEAKYEDSTSRTHEALENGNRTKHEASESTLETNVTEQHAEKCEEKPDAKPEESSSLKSAEEHHGTIDEQFNDSDNQTSSEENRRTSETEQSEVNTAETPEKQLAEGSEGELQVKLEPVLAEQQIKSSETPLEKSEQQCDRHHENESDEQKESCETTGEPEAKIKSEADGTDRQEKQETGPQKASNEVPEEHAKCEDQSETMLRTPIEEEGEEKRTEIIIMREDNIGEILSETNIGEQDVSLEEPDTNEEEIGDQSNTEAEEEVIGATAEEEELNIKVTTNAVSKANAPLISAVRVEVREFKPTTANDPTLSVLRELFIRSFDEYYKQIESKLSLKPDKTLVEWLDQTFDDEARSILSGTYRCFVLYSNEGEHDKEDVLGFLTLKEESAQSIYIAQVAVRLDIKRRGHGAQLLQHLRSIYPSNTYYWGLCRRANQPALKFYLKNGARFMNNDDVAAKYKYDPKFYAGFEFRDNASTPMPQIHTTQPTPTKYDDPDPPRNETKVDHAPPTASGTEQLDKKDSQRRKKTPCCSAS